MRSKFSGWCDVEYELVADNYFIVLAPCGCGGDPECGCANGAAVVDEIDMGPLLHNLAIAGALERFYRVGYGASKDVYWTSRCWEPNVKGIAAPDEEIVVP